MKQVFIVFCLCFLFLASNVAAQDILIEVDSAKAGAFSSKLLVGDIHFHLKPLLENQRWARNWYIATPDRATGMSGWDLAHYLVNGSKDVLYAEPDQIYVSPDYAKQKRSGNAGQRSDEEDWYDEKWAYPDSNVFAWHLQDNFSQLATARKDIYKGGKRVRIAHFDTGYDPTHITAPLYIRTDLQKNFVAGEDENSAVDPGVDCLMCQPGHGTATLALLAGNHIKRTENNFDDYIGGAPFAEIVPVRVAKSVILIYTSNFAQALYYAIETQCDVVSMSMGGVASKLWADAVNDAYENGITVVTAAGNNVGELPFVNVVYPARFKRVIAACGVTYDHQPYFKFEFPSIEMQGNFGPLEIMEYAMAAYTPNTPWALMGTVDKIDLDGAGTSSATPQVAAAAALWLQKYNSFQYEHPWQRVNAVRHALFSSAEKDLPDLQKYYGNGVLRAANALAVPPKLDSTPIEKDEVTFPLLTLLLGWGSDGPPENQIMYEVELLQLKQNNRNLQQLFAKFKGKQRLAEEQKTKTREAIINITETSNSLSRLMQQ